MELLGRIALGYVGVVAGLLVAVFIIAIGIAMLLESSEKSKRNRVSEKAKREKKELEEKNRKEWEEKFAKVRATRLYDSILSNSCVVINREIKRVPLKIEKLPPSKWYSYIHVSIGEENCCIYNQDKLNDSFTVDYKNYGIRFLYSEEQYNFNDVLMHDLKEKYSDLTVEYSRSYNGNVDFSISFDKIYEKHKPKTKF